MLVLTRKQNQSIIINDEIELIVIEIGADSIKLGVKAPKDIIIHRKEIYEKIKKEMESASKSPLPESPPSNMDKKNKL